MSQQQQQSRTFSVGSSKLPVKGGIAGASTTLSTHLLPPRITDDALTSFYRLDASPNSILKWDRYDCSKADAKHIEDISETLLELRYAEYLAGRADRCDEDNSISTLYNMMLWSLARSNGIDDGEEDRPSLWIMKLSDKEPIAKALAFASSDDRKQVSKSKEILERKISKAGLAKTSGHIQLKDFFSAKANQGRDDPISLCPQKQHAELHSRFMRGVEDLLQAHWSWKHSKQVGITHDNEERPAATSKTPRRKADDNDEEIDEEEEGAIKDAGKQENMPPSIDLQYWPRVSSAAKVLTRFRGGALLRYSSPSNAAMDIYADGVDKLLHITLHCSLDEHGHLYVLTRPQDICGLQSVQDVTLERNAGIIAPDGLPVTMIDQVNGLEWPQQERHSSGGEEKTSDEFLMVLRKMLLLRGVDVTLLDDQWILCETSDHVRFLWPLKLCLVKSSEEQRRVKANQLRLLCKPLPDLAERAKRLVKESIGIPMSEEIEESIMMDDGDGVGDPNVMLKEEMVEDGELDSERSRESDDDDDEQRQEGQSSSENSNKLVNGGDVMPDEVLTGMKVSMGMGDVQSGSKSSTSPSIISKANSLSRYDDDTDLWGTFGFGAEDNEGKGSIRRESGAGLDEGGFGLITEDDFSFFDDANRGGGGESSGVFDEMDVDLQSRDELLNSIGNTNEQRLELDTISDMAMTNSTFVDPPSLPGFTPGSFSATSPAVGGLNAKTPRTPFSPSQDMIDANITIEGESDSLLYNRHHFSHDALDAQQNLSQVDLADLTSHDRIKDDQRVFEGKAANQKLDWTKRDRNNLLSKYEQGKYAMLNAQSTNSQSIEKEKSAGDIPRNRLRNRHFYGRRLSGSSSARGIPARTLRRLALSSLEGKSDEDTSDVDVTLDGTMSAQSSLMDDDSDNEGSSVSGETSEEDDMAIEVKIKYLQSSIDRLQGGSLPEVAIIEQTDSSEEARQIELVPFLDMLMANPQIHLVCSDKPKAKMIARSSTTHLFDPLPCQYSKSTLASLLHMPPIEGEKAIRIYQETASHYISPLHPPKIMIGSRGSITVMESSALSYWDIAALSPVSGPKHIVALALHCGSLLPSWQSELLDWFTTLKLTFNRSGLGSHNLVKDGLLGLGESHSTSIAQILAQTTYKTEQWADTLESLLSRLQIDLKRGAPVVIYTINIRINPEYSWIYPRLQKDLRELAWKRWQVAPDLITIWPMAWSSLTSTMQCNPERNISLLRMSLSIYDAVQIPIKPNVNRKRHLPSVSAKPIGVRHPYFTLVPSQPLGRSSTSFHLDWNADPFNLLDCGMLLHVAYSIANAPGQLTFVAIIDEKAQGYYMNGWRRQSSLLSELELIWKEVQGYARRARILWRVVICKEEAMNVEEIHHWSSIIKQSQEAPFRALDVTLICLEQSTPMTIVLPRQISTETIETISSTTSNASDGSRHHFIRADQFNYAIYPPFRIDYGSTNTRSASERCCILALQSSVIVSLSNQYNGATMQVNTNATEWSPSAPHYSWLHILLIYNTRYSNPSQDLTLASRMRLITESFHNLTFVAKEKLLTRDNLPWHITILAIAQRACHLF